MQIRLRILLECDPQVSKDLIVSDVQGFLQAVVDKYDLVNFAHLENAELDWDKLESGKTKNK